MLSTSLASRPAVAETGRRHLVIACLMTEGCILHTTRGALRRDYAVSLVIDATAGRTPPSTMPPIPVLQLGVIPVSWLSFASELQRTYDNAGTVGIYFDIQMQAPGFARTSRPGGRGSAPHGITAPEDEELSIESCRS